MVRAGWFLAAMVAVYSGSPSEAAARSVEGDAPLDDARESSPRPNPAAAEASGRAKGADVDPECDRLFGSSTDREANAEARSGRLILVEEGPAYIDVVQTGGWSEPTEIAYRGLTLKQTETSAEGESVAVIEVEPSLEFCEPGEYEVEVDDSIGADGQILAILPGLLVVEHGDGLRYVRSDDYRGRPIFKVSWRSPFSVVVETKSSGSSKRSARRRRRRRR